MKKILCISMIAACCGLILEDADASRRMAQATAAGESAVANMLAARRGRVAPVAAPVQQQQVVPPVVQNIPPTGNAVTPENQEQQQTTTATSTSTRTLPIWTPNYRSQGE